MSSKLSSRWDPNKQEGSYSSLCSERSENAAMRLRAEQSLMASVCVFGPGGQAPGYLWSHLGEEGALGGF